MEGLALQQICLADVVDTARGKLKDLHGAAASRDAKAAEAAAKDFESILLQQVMQEMQQTVDKSGLLEDSTNDQVQSLFWMNLAQEVGSKGGIGLWKQLYQQIAPAQAPAAAEGPR